MPSKDIKNRRIRVSGQTTLHPCSPYLFTNSPACIVTASMLNDNMSKKTIFTSLYKVLESLKPRIESYQKLYFGAWLAHFCPYSMQWELPGTLRSLLPVLFTEAQLIPLPRAGVARAPCLRSAEHLPLSYHRFSFPFFSLHQHMFPTPPSVSC